MYLLLLNELYVVINVLQDDNREDDNYLDRNLAKYLII